MFYRDITLQMPNVDVHFFMKQIITHIHEQHHAFPVAIDFPDWQDGCPGRSRAHHGRVLRLFAHRHSTLDKAVATLNLYPLLERGLVATTPTLAVPDTPRQVAYYRSRQTDMCANKSRKLQEHENPYSLDYKLVRFWLTSTKGDGTNSIALRIGREFAECAPSDRLVVGSYGVSRKHEPVWLPSF